MVHSCETLKTCLEKLETEWSASFWKTKTATVGLFNVDLTITRLVTFCRGQFFDYDLKLSSRVSDCLWPIITGTHIERLCFDKDAERNSGIFICK